MTPYKANIYIYANSEDEVIEFQQLFYDFVNSKREQGIAVTATKLTQALKAFGSNPFLNNYLR